MRQITPEMIISRLKKLGDAPLLIDLGDGQSRELKSDNFMIDDEGVIRLAPEKMMIVENQD